MHGLTGFLVDIILARQSIGVALILAVAAAVYTNRSYVREIAGDPMRFWRGMARAAAAAVIATLAWVAVFDDWLQLVIEPYRHSLRWNYQRVVYDPVDPTLRAVSVVLLALALVTLACLFARHVGGYGTQIVTLVLAVLFWMPLFIMNQRLNALIIQGGEATDTLPEALGLTAFWLVRLTIGVVTIGMSMLAATMLVALVATLVLDLLHLRAHRMTHEADGFFSELGKRAEVHEDIPLRTFWRPIRRPL